MKRISYENLWKKINDFKPMIFISGPRQSGKTTLAKSIADNFTNSIYFNWDVLNDRKKLVENPYYYQETNRKDASKPLVILDELHKYSDWKNYLKGVYDRDSSNFSFIVSGSGRLDIYQKGGDSLAGRYLRFTLFPFTIGELSINKFPFAGFMDNPQLIPEPSVEASAHWSSLEKHSGFPEPFLKGENDFYKLWSSTYRNQVLREDIRDMAALRNFTDVEMLFSLLPSRVGSPLSMANLAGDLKVSFDSVRNWLELFERFYLVFRISPYSKKISRAISKEKKLYLYDYASISSGPAKFENMVALELLRTVSFWNDSGTGAFSLEYVRNREKLEVDFLIVKDEKPFLLVEAKLSDTDASPSLKYFQEVLGIPAVQLVKNTDACKLVQNGKHKILVSEATRWLASLPVQRDN
ncbi:MAG: ATP-binding protein [Lentisphaerota bacterium]